MEAALESVVSARNDLAAEVVRSAGEVRLRVTGSSMLPAIRPGDELVIRRCGIPDASVGEVVLYAREGRLFVHRAIARSGDTLLVQGDALPAPDPSVAASEFLGKVVRAWRGGKPVAIRSGMNYRQRTVAECVRRSMLAARLITRFCTPKVRAAP